jgi:hypothetical protein
MEHKKPKHSRKRKITLDLPPEFIAVCQADGVDPKDVLRGFIADLGEIMNWQSAPREDGYSSNGSDERRMAREYYERVGYPWWHKNG